MNVAISTYNRTCRACLCLVPSDTEEYILYANVSAEMFSICTSLQVTENDLLPKILCQLCYETLLKVHEFREMSSRSYTLLQSLISDSDIKPNLASLSNYIFSTDSPNENETKVKLPGFKRTGEEAVEIELMNRMDNSSDSEEKSKRVVLKKEKVSKKRKKLLKKPRPPPKIQEKEGYDLPCDQCFRKYDYPERLEAHKLTFHENKPAVIKCATCGKVFKAWQTFRHHKQSVHESVSLADLKCNICGKVFKTRLTLYSHKRKHLAKKGVERRFSCHICGQKLATQNYLNTHLAAHSTYRPGFPCALCDKTFSTSSGLDTHVSNKHSGKTYTCDYCQIAFKSKSGIVLHIHRHLGVKPHSCDICQRTFATSGGAIQHRRTHTGERPFLCDFCPKTFASKPQMVNHRRIHTGEKPNKCGQCDKSFIQRSTLVRHMKTHKGFSL